MKPVSVYIIATLLMISMFSCNRIPENVKQTLELAGENKKELGIVIDHYQAPKDSLKLKAAYFLLGNMANKYSLAGERLENYNVIFDKIEAVSKKRPFNYANKIDNKFHEVDSIWKEVSEKEGFLNSLNLEIKPDVQYITSSYLIENIEYAFKAWGFPWSKHLSFDEFCEYILPYRFRDETLTSWRPYVFNKYLPLLDSLKHIKNPVALCDTINKRLTASWKYSRVLANYPVAMTMENMDKGKMGSCTHQAGLGVFVMRALGVPAVHEQVPHYGNRSLGHDFNAVLDKDSKFLDFEVGNAKIGNVVDTRKSWNILIPKIYRQTFSFNEESLAAIKSSQEEVPPYFKNLNIMDVTAQYLPVSDITIELTQPIPEGSNHVYLCVFDNKNWKAVSWAKINNKALFKNMGLGFVYIPMYYNNRIYVSSANPMILDEEGELVSINLHKREQTIILERKYPLPLWFKKLKVKGKFQVANRINFSDKVNLYEVDTFEAPIYQEVKTKTLEKYRYVRYLFPPNDKVGIAEMSFFSKKETQLLGKIITSENISINSAKNVFDENVLSYFNTKNRDSVEHWIGLDFGTKKKISKISFCPRTDKNNVWKGLNYELFYWDNEWISLGIKKAETYSLTYDSPISNALYLLRCLDEGKEERIFTYENSKQVWW